MRLPAGIVPAERYLADTVAKLSQQLNSIESTRSLGPGIRAQTTYPRVKGYILILIKSPLLIPDFRFPIDYIDHTLIS